jgi:hypothetical protein
MHTAPVPVSIETSLQLPSMSRSIFSLSSIATPPPRADRKDSLMLLESNQDIKNNSFKALENFTPVFPDEILVSVCDSLRSLATFKDGYIYGINETTNAKGIFAASCIYPSGSAPRLSEALKSVRSCRETPIDKLGKTDLEIALGKKEDQDKSNWKMLLIAGCVLTIVIIAVVLLFT